MSKIEFDNEEVFNILKQEAARRLGLRGDVHADATLTAHTDDGKEATYTFKFETKGTSYMVISDPDGGIPDDGKIYFFNPSQFVRMEDPETGKEVIKLRSDVFGKGLADIVPLQDAARDAGLSDEETVCLVREVINRSPGSTTTFINDENESGESGIITAETTRTAYIGDPSWLAGGSMEEYPDAQVEAHCDVAQGDMITFRESRPEMEPRGLDHCSDMFDCSIREPHFHSFGDNRLAQVNGTLYVYNPSGKFLGKLGVEDHGCHVGSVNCIYGASADCQHVPTPPAGAQGWNPVADPLYYGTYRLEPYAGDDLPSADNPGIKNPDMNYESLFRQGYMPPHMLPMGIPMTQDTVEADKRAREADAASRAMKCQHCGVLIDNHMRVSGGYVCPELVESFETAPQPLTIEVLNVWTCTNHAPGNEVKDIPQGKKCGACGRGE